MPLEANPDICAISYVSKESLSDLEGRKSRTCCPVGLARLDCHELVELHNVLTSRGEFGNDIFDGYTCH
jgi:hypothetical protein